MSKLTALINFGTIFVPLIIVKSLEGKWTLAKKNHNHVNLLAIFYTTKQVLFNTTKQVLLMLWAVQKWQYLTK